jgi:stearoyl-CoA desaturase (delta-9 desaturase)
MGFRWYEVDLSHLALRAMSWFGLVWDLKEPPKHLLKQAVAEGVRPPAGVS